jgi:hypothetical protein
MRWHVGDSGRVPILDLLWAFLTTLFMVGVTAALYVYHQSYEALPWGTLDCLATPAQAGITTFSEILLLFGSPLAVVATGVLTAFAFTRKRKGKNHSQYNVLKKRVFLVYVKFWLLLGLMMGGGTYYCTGDLHLELPTFWIL